MCNLQVISRTRTLFATMGPDSCISKRDINKAWEVRGGREKWKPAEEPMFYSDARIENHSHDQLFDVCTRFSVYSVYVLNSRVGNAGVVEDPALIANTVVVD